MARLLGGCAPLVVEVPALGFGEPDAETGRSRLGRDEEVGVMLAVCDEFMRRGIGVDGSRGDAMVDMAVCVCEGKLAGQTLGGRRMISS